jgi:hypothetical protein
MMMKMAMWLQRLLLLNEDDGWEMVVDFTLILRL